MRMIPGMREFIKPADDVIKLELLPTPLNSIVPEVDCQLHSLPLRHGGLGIKTGERYEKITSAIRCKLSFLILKSAFMYVRGYRSHNLRTIDKFELVLHLARIE